MNKKINKLPIFNDFLGLKKENFNDIKLIIFYGISGSGKSSNLHYLADYHPSFLNQSVHWIWSHHKKSSSTTPQKCKLVVVDEITSPIQIPLIFNLLKKNQKVAVASHLQPAWFKILLPFISIKFFCTDNSPEKIESFLSQKKISYSKESIKYFIRKYGSNYLDLLCILENYKGESFDDALNLNRKFMKIKHHKPRDWTPSLPKLKFD